MRIKFSSIFIVIFMICVSKFTKIDANSNMYLESPVSSNGEDIVLDGIKVIKRDDWFAQPPSQPLEKLNLPVKYVFISHTATDSCTSEALCILRVRTIQTFHMSSKNWADIGYNFLVGGDGNVYEGRSWDNVGAHTFNYNNISIGISFIGAFNNFIPPKSQIFAAQKLIEKGVKLGKISKNYMLLGHRQVAKTKSPGDALYAVMQKWPHWSLKPSNSGDIWHYDVNIIKREKWLAQPPSQPLEKLSLPVKYVFISHTATDSCTSDALCALRVQIIQTFHMSSKNLADIGYNFLVGGDGNVYEGRSWDNVGAHTFNYNNISIGISFIGTFNDFIPPKSQIFAAQKLIEKGVELGKISKNYTLLGHRQVAKTESPGDALYAVMQTWPQWSPNP